MYKKHRNLSRGQVKSVAQPIYKCGRCVHTTHHIHTHIFFLSYPKENKQLRGIIIITVYIFTLAYHLFMCREICKHGLPLCMDVTAFPAARSQDQNHTFITPFCPPKSKKQHVRDSFFQSILTPCQINPSR